MGIDGLTNYFVIILLIITIIIIIYSPLPGR